MNKKKMGGFGLFLILSSLMTSNPVSSTSINTSSCPLDLTYVQTLPWNTSGCQNSPQTNLNITKQFCCPNILSLFKISLAKRLKETSIFFLPDISTSVSCLNDFQNKLNSLSLFPNLSSICLGSPKSWVIDPKTCAGIQSKQDWINKLGPITKVDSYCKSGLTDLTYCDACMNAELKVHSHLVSLDGNISNAGNCLSFALVYAAGIVNEHGPDSLDSASCIFWLPIVSSLGSKGRNKSALFYSLISAALAIAFISCFFGLYIWWDRGKKKKDFRVRSVDLDLDLDLDLDISKLNPGSFGFSIKELKRATDDFSEKKLIGQGGFGVVYKGKLGDGTLIAVKKIIETDLQGDTEFCKEIKIIGNLKHRNLVPLIGCCIAVKNLSLDEQQEEEEQEKQRYIVYAYMPNKSLHDHLFLKKNPLNWPQRKSIILDVAKGLAYLHYGVKPPIYHRDIKATNILLDSDMRARIADFGLAKQGREGRSRTTTIVAGTHGYLAPEYALYGQLTEKSDVYSFGVLVLEVMSGRKALNLPSSSSSSGSSSEAFLITDWAWELVKSGHVEEILDPVLLKNDGCSSNPRGGVMERFILVGILCAHVMVAFRPNILDALKMLEGDIAVPPIPSRPSILNRHFSPYSENGSSTENE